MSRLQSVSPLGDDPIGDPIDDVLAELHELGPAIHHPDPGPVLDRVTVRALALRRRRRGLAVATPVLAAAVAAGLLTAPLLGGRGVDRSPSGRLTPSLQPAVPSPRTSPSGTPTRAGTKVPSPLEQVLPLAGRPDLIYLPDRRFGDPTGYRLSQMNSTSVESERDAPEAIAVRFGAATGDPGQPGRPVVAALVVYPPQPFDPLKYGPRTSLAKLSRVAVHGMSGQLADEPGLHEQGRVFELTWREAGTRSWWVVEAAGMSRADVLQAANGLRISRGHLDQASLPPGLTRMPATYVWHEACPVFMADFAAGPDTQASLGAWRVAVFPQGAPENPLVHAAQSAPGTVRTVDLGGTTAFLYSYSLDPHDLLFVRDGLTFVVSGLPDEQAIAVARTLARAQPDDSRLTGSQRLPPEPFLSPVGRHLGRTAPPSSQVGPTSQTRSGP